MDCPVCKIKRLRNLHILASHMFIHIWDKDIPGEFEKTLWDYQDGKISGKEFNRELSKVVNTPI